MEAEIHAILLPLFTSPLLSAEVSFGISVALVGFSGGPLSLFVSVLLDIGLPAVEETLLPPSIGNAKIICNAKICNVWSCCVMMKKYNL